MVRDLDLVEDEPSPKPGHVWITRRRWDGYFLPAVPAAALIGALSWWMTENARLLMAPLIPMVALWALIRWLWPRGGSLVRTLSGTPGTIPLLWWLSIWFLIALVGIAALDAWLPLPPKGQPVTWRQALIVGGFGIVWFAGLLIGGHGWNFEPGSRRLQSILCLIDLWLLESRR